MWLQQNKSCVSAPSSKRIHIIIKLFLTYHALLILQGETVRTNPNLLKQQFFCYLKPPPTTRTLYNSVFSKIKTKFLHGQSLHWYLPVFMKLSEIIQQNIVGFSVNRFGRISPLWQIFQELGYFLMDYELFGKMFMQQMAKD